MLFLAEVSQAKYSHPSPTPPTHGKMGRTSIISSRSIPPRRVEVRRVGSEAAGWRLLLPLGPLLWQGWEAMGSEPLACCWQCWLFVLVVSVCYSSVLSLWILIVLKRHLTVLNGQCLIKVVLIRYMLKLQPKPLHTPPSKRLITLAV